jgi:signal transduction histidine kinase
MPARTTAGRSHLTGLAVVATACAAGLVLYLQFRAITALGVQTHITLEQITQQGAADVADELRRVLDGPVVDTLTAVAHPDLRAGRLDLVGEQFRAGLTAYPHVDEFFAWHSRDGPTHEAVLFYGRGGAFGPKAVLGRAVMALAREYASAQQIYVASHGIRRDQYIFLRLFWIDATRRDFFAILGFVVDASRLRERLFGATRRQALDNALRRRAADIPVRLSVTDERGVVIYGDAASAPVTTRIPFALLFYPGDEVHSRLAVGIEPRVWTIAVAAEAPQAASFAWQGYGLTAVSLILMAVAATVTVRAHRRLVELTDMQADFVAHVSHQLKTPLSLLRAAVETVQLDRVRSRERLAEYLATIDTEAARLSALVQRVLEFSRMQQRPNYEFEPIDLGRLTRETVDAFARGLSERSFSCEPSGAMAGPYVRGDPAALEQALANLLDNAVKYSDPHTPIRVRIDAARGRAMVDVIDRGIGIAGVDQGRIFERFFRAGNAARRPGFGLGLTIVREVAHVHGGEVAVRSTPGQGSTFRITLPLDAAPQPAVEQRPVNTSEVRP